MDISRKTTKNHDEIKLWVENHSGKPQKMDHPDATADSIGLRFDFPGGADEEYKVMNEAIDVTWDEFFELFDKKGMAFEYWQDQPNKNPSDLYRFIKS